MYNSRVGGFIIWRRLCRSTDWRRVALQPRCCSWFFFRVFANGVGRGRTNACHHSFIAVRINFDFDFGCPQQLSIVTVLLPEDGAKGRRTKTLVNHVSCSQIATSCVTAASQHHWPSLSLSLSLPLFVRMLCRCPVSPIHPTGSKFLLSTTPVQLYSCTEEEKQRLILPVGFRPLCEPYE